MTYRFSSVVVAFAGLVLVSVPAAAAPIASCNANFTVCGIPENLLLQLPFGAIAGDVVLTDPNNNTVSDVFRIFNNLIDTGAGTGLGNLVFLYSSDDTALPAPATYSANVVFLAENPSGITSYLGNGTTYLLGVPEPRTIGLLSLAAAMTLLLHARAQ
jgi:hypothetical protein